MNPIAPRGRKGSTRLPVLTIFICVVCAGVFAFTPGERDLSGLAYHAHSFDVISMFTSVFVHMNSWHLAGNLLVFFFFARTIEMHSSTKGYVLAFVLFVLVTNIAFSLAAKGPTWTVGLSGVVWGFMGLFLFRFPAIIFIVAFLALNVAEYRHLENPGVNYIAHFSGFSAGVLFRVLTWGVFTMDKPEPRRRPSFPARPTHARPMRR